MRNLILMLIAAAVPAAAARQFDVVVYGGTAGGAIAAIASAREGMRVALVEPGRHVGGMISGGPGRTDMNRQENIDSRTVHASAAARDREYRRAPQYMIAGHAAV